MWARRRKHFSPPSVKPRAGRLKANPRPIASGFFAKLAGVAWPFAIKEFKPSTSRWERRSSLPTLPTSLARLDAEQLAIWIAGAPEPQRTALALFYLDEFDHHELLSLLEIKVTELSALLAQARRQFQAWLDAVVQIEAR